VAVRMCGSRPPTSRIRCARGNLKESGDGQNSIRFVFNPGPGEREGLEVDTCVVGTDENPRGSGLEETEAAATAHSVGLVAL